MGSSGWFTQFTGQTRLIVPDQRDAILPGNIFCRHDHKFIPCNAGTEGDLANPSARNLAANRGSEEHVRQNHIVDVLRLSSYLVATFLAWNRRADDAVCIHLKIDTRVPERGDGIVYDKLDGSGVPAR